MFDNEVRRAIRNRDIRKVPMLYRLGHVEEAIDIMLDSRELCEEALTKARQAVSILKLRGDLERATRFQALADRAQKEVSFWAGWETNQATSNPERSFI